MTGRPPRLLTRAENIEKWVKSDGGRPAARRRILAAVALIEAMEAKHGHRYDVPEKK